jgi:hypothetical protein
MPVAVFKGYADFIIRNLKAVKSFGILFFVLSRAEPTDEDLHLTAS